jgi:predicted outer membrane repeat protein
VQNCQNSPILIIDSSPTLQNLQIQNCQSAEQGGAVFIQGASSPMIRSCTFSNNVAYGQGFLLFSVAKSLCFVSHLRFCILPNKGGAIYANNVQAADPLTVFNCTFSNNFAQEDGGGAFLTGLADISASQFWVC